MTMVGVMVCALLFVLSGASVILVKLFSGDENVTDSNSFFLLTNVLIAVLCTGVLRFTAKKTLFHRPTLLRLGKLFNLRQVSYIFFKTMLANGYSVLQVVILRDMNVSTYTVLSSSLLLLGAVAVSGLVFREKQSKIDFVVVGLVIAALIINP